MTDKAGVLSVVFLAIAAGAGFASFLADKWIATDSDHLNVGQHCFKLENTTVCTELENTTKRTVCKLILQWSPAYSLIVIVVLLTSLFRHLRKAMCAASIMSSVLAAAFVTALMLFSNTHYWTSSQRSKWSPKYGFFLAIAAALFSLISAILGMVSFRKFREKVGDSNLDVDKIVPSTRGSTRRIRPSKFRTRS